MKIAAVLFAALAAIWFVPSTPAQEVQYTAVLSGAAESPPTNSPGTGTALVTIDVDSGTMRVESSFSSLLGNVSAAHIHCCTTDPGVGNVGVATPTPTFPGFPSGVTSGAYDMTFDLNQASSFNPSFVTNNGGSVSGAMNALVSGLDTGRAYLNIHTSSFSGGEIRGFLQVVPEPSTYCLLLMGLGVTPYVQRMRKRAGRST